MVGFVYRLGVGYGRKKGYRVIGTVNNYFILLALRVGREVVSEKNIFFFFRKIELYRDVYTYRIFGVFGLRWLIVYL